MTTIDPQLPVLERMVQAVEKVRNRCRARADGKGRRAVRGDRRKCGSAWVATVAESAVRNTQDVDILSTAPT